MNLAHAEFTHWISIGPEGGSVETLAIGPQAPNTLYAGGGVFSIQQITGRMDIADFDGDGKTDVSGFHLPSDQFFTDYAGNLGQFGWGESDSMPLVWDYDGDGKTDVSIYHIPTNQWFVKGVGNLGQYGWGEKPWGQTFKIRLQRRSPNVRILRLIGGIHS